MRKPDHWLPDQHLPTIEFWGDLLTDAIEKDQTRPHSTNPRFWEQQCKRWLCRNDLFYLLVEGCKRIDMNHPWIFERCREVQFEPNGYLDLWAREHYKSTIITFGLSIQDILASHGDAPEDRYEGREVTIGILSFNAPTAKDFLKQIKLELENNEDLQTLFPDVLYRRPEYQAPQWSIDRGIIVKRQSNPKEPTVMASGLVDGQPTGMHFLVKMYDDVVTRESVGTPEQIKKTTEAWELSDNLGTEGGVERYAGTRYAMQDSYKVMMDREIPARIHPCTKNGIRDWEKAKLVKPEHAVLKKPEDLEDKRRKQGPYTFGAQMLLDPTADTSQGFQEEWIQYWRAESSRNLNTYILVDPAGEKKKDSDFTAMWVVGVGGDENFYILDGVHDRLNLVERQRHLFRLHRAWRPRDVYYEKYGKDSDIEHMETVMERDNYRFTITGVGGALSKADRIKRLVPYFEEGRIFLPDTGLVRINYEQHSVDIIKTFIEEEYKTFPVCVHDDQLDCLSRICDASITYPEPSTDDPYQKPDWMKKAEEQYGTDEFEDFMTG